MIINIRGLDIKVDQKNEESAIHNIKYISRSIDALLEINNPLDRALEMSQLGGYILCCAANEFITDQIGTQLFDLIARLVDKPEVELENEMNQELNRTFMSIFGKE